MVQVTLRFYEELSDFLPTEKKKQDFSVAFPLARSVKDLIESLGVPHVEVDLILVNGKTKTFDYLVADGDRISVYPIFERLDITSATKLRPEPLRRSRFIIDVHLKTLAKRLRLLGFDSLYDQKFDDIELARISENQRRILLTRDRQLLMRKNVSRGLFIRNTKPALQLIEVAERLDLTAQLKPFTRCTECNGEIHPVSLDSVVDLLPRGVQSWCREFHRCGNCGKVYWKGSHYVTLTNYVESFLHGNAAKSVESARGVSAPG